MIIELGPDLLKKPIIWIAAGVLIVGLSVGGYFAYKYRSQIFGSPATPIDNLTSNGQLTPDQTKKLVAEVGKLISLPEGETPTVATITDVSKLAGQEFFKKAQNGDQVLIYTQAKKAYLYSPTLKKILDVEPINLNATPSATLAPEPTTSFSSPIPSIKPTPTHKVASPSATLIPTP